MWIELRGQKAQEYVRIWWLSKIAWTGTTSNFGTFHRSKFVTIPKSKLGTGTIDTISIRLLQIILLKLSLLTGVQVKTNERFIKIKEPTLEKSWTVLSELKCSDGTFVINQEEYDAVICASGKKCAGSRI